MESEDLGAVQLRCRQCGREGVRRKLLDVFESVQAKAVSLRINSAYGCAGHPVGARKAMPVY